MRKLTLLWCFLLCPGFAMAGWDEAQAAYKKGDYKTAAKEMKILAAKGDVKAQVNLGAMYADGQGVPRSYKMAIKWYLQAADHGNTKAQVNISELYMTGQGVPRDEVQALKWNIIAANGGDPDGARYRDTLAQRMTAAEVKKARNLAQSWVLKHPTVGKH